LATEEHITGAMSEPVATPSTDSVATNFVREIVEADVQAGKAQGRVATRFPPEPNGYLHIGHAKSICLNFGLAQKFGGTCNLRLDDTNPLAESEEYVRSIIEDVRWLGFDYDDRLYYASDYFLQIYEWAEQLVREGRAYVDDRGLEEIRSSRGNFYAVGQESPYRNRGVAENLDLLRKMRAGEFGDGERVLRAKIDMSSANQNMRDPVMYRIRHAHHHRTGDTWCLYPMYDWAHGLCDAIEQITHSVCTLEFEDHRPLYDWFLVELGITGDRKPQQIEFARLNLTYTVLSKRRLQQLVEEKIVGGWDDPRMPSLAGMRRRGFTPESIRKFCDQIGVSKREGTVDVQLLEFIQREDLNQRCRRAMGVLRPLRLTIENWPKDQVRDVELLNHPEYADQGTRRVPFSGTLFVEEDDFREVAPPKWHRLAPGQEVRLRGACLVTCKQIIKDSSGKVVELRCDYDPNSWGGQAPNGRRVKGTLHWVSEAHAIDAEVRLYDRLFTAESPMGSAEGVDWRSTINPNSLETCPHAKLEPSLGQAPVLDRFQLERLGYFCVDRDTTRERVVLNRTLTLKDAWAKIEKKLGTA
jgi:glutaminyl-tRNA synthetase